MPLDFSKADIDSILHLPGYVVFNPKDDTKPAQLLGVTDGDEASVLTIELEGEPVISPNGPVAMSYTGTKGTFSVTTHNISKDNWAQLAQGSVNISQDLDPADLTKGTIEYNSYSTVEIGFEMAFFPIYKKADGTYSNLTSNDMAIWLPNAMLTTLPELNLAKTEHAKNTFEFQIGTGYTIASNGLSMVLGGEGITFSTTPERLEYTRPTP